MRSYAAFNQTLFKRYEQWMLIQQYSLGTKYSYRQTLRLYVEFLKDKAVTQVAQTDIRRFMLRLAENGVSLITARRHLWALRRFYDFLNLGGLVTYVAPRLISVRQTPAKTPQHLSEPEVVRLIRAAQSLREKALVEFFYGTGCRLGEVLTLRIRDIDFRERTARVTGKYGKTRVVLLTDRAVQALRNYIGTRDAGYVFQHEYRRARGSVTVTHGAWYAQWWEYGKHQSKYLRTVRKMSRPDAEEALAEMMKRVPPGRPPKDRPLTPMTVGKVIREMGYRAGLPRAHAHMIRRTFATHLHEHGADLSAIQKLLGHVNIETTAKYASLSAFRLNEVFDRCHPFGRFHVKGSPKHAETIHENAKPETAALDRRRSAIATLVSADKNCKTY